MAPGETVPLVPPEIRDRDLSTFLLGDNVYELASGTIPHVAERLGVDIGAEPTSAALYALAQAVGKNKVLRNNVALPGMELDELAELAEGSGVQNPLNRSLWTPAQRIALPHEYGTVAGLQEDGMHVFAPDRGIIGGAVANWGDRAEVETMGSLHSDVPVDVIVGNRLMDSSTEVTNPNVITFRDGSGRLPTEIMYYARFVLPRAGVSGHHTALNAYETKEGDELARRYIADNPHVLEEKLVVVRNANAAIQLATQIRVAARAQAIDGRFDSDPNDPQLFVVTDTRPLAQTAAQLKQPRLYQAPQPALRQAIVTAKVLHEAAGGQ